MRKSKIVSHSSEAIKRLPDQSDWVRNAAMTDEEIDAAIASDPDEAALDDHWMEHGVVVRSKARFVMCTNNKKYASNLTLHKVYKVIADESSDKSGWLHIVDETGKGGFYPVDCFVPVQIPFEAERDFDLMAV